MAKLSLTQKPTFTRAAKIPVAGEKAVEVMFTYQARTKDVMKQWIETLNDPTKDIHEAAMECAIGWELDEEFGLENMKVLEQNYMGAMRSIINAYIDEQTAARMGN